jgi:YVTN family beta-propeller protein
MRGSIATATLGPGGTTVYIPDNSVSSVLAVDPSTLSVTATIGVASVPTAAVSPSSGADVFVAGATSNSISEIDAATNRVSRSISVGELSQSVTGDNPVAILVTPNGEQIYSAGSDYQSSLSEVDVATGAVHGVPCPNGMCEVETMAASPDSTKVYLAGFIFTGDSSPPFFYVVSTATKTVTVAKRLKAIGAMAMAPSGATLYMSVGTSIAIYNTATNAFTGSIAVSGALSLACSPDGLTLYAGAGSSVFVISTATNTVTSTISLGSFSGGAISVSPDGSQVWVAEQKGTSVAVIETANGTFQTVNFGQTVSGVGFGVN